MRRICLCLLCLLLVASFAFADEAAFVWSTEMGGDGITSPSAMVLSAQGGMFIVGHTTSNNSDFGEGLGGQDGLILRLNAEGNLQWWRRMGGSGEDVFTTVLETEDGGCLAMGTTTSTDGDARASRGGMDAWVVRLDASGETMWVKCLGGSADDELTVLLDAGEGRYFACGRTQSRNGDLGANFGGWDAWAVLISGEDGKLLERSYRYGHAGDDAFIQAVSVDGGWLLLGEVDMEIARDEEDNVRYSNRPMVQIINADGLPRWEEPVPLGVDTGTNKLSAIAQAGSGWLLGGVTNSSSSLMPARRGGMDIWTLQLRETQTVAWQRSYGGSRDESVQSIHMVPDGGYVMLGQTASNDGHVFGGHGETDIWVVRITASGALQWQQTIGGSDVSEPVGLLQTEDGGFLVCGTTLAQDGDVGRHPSVRTGLLARLAPNGNLLEIALIAPTEELRPVQIATREGTAYILGSVRSMTGEGAVETIWIGRLQEEGFMDE